MKVLFSATQFALLVTLPAAAQDATRAPSTAEDDRAAASSRAASPVQPRPDHAMFIADPLSDGAILSFALGIGALSEAILGTKEIKPQAPGDHSTLLSIDRNAVEQTPDAAWRTVNTVGLVGAVGFAALDPVLTGIRHDAEAGLVDAIIYGQTLSITWSTTNLTKLAVRRPRPRAYREARRLREQGVPEEDIPGMITDTNSALSFFSGHASVTAAVTATASYLAFARAPRSPRPWITLGVGTLATALTCVARVRSGEHFPTDVIAGAMVGFGVGVLVPHSHRAEVSRRHPAWIGAAPMDDGGLVTVSGLF